MTVIYYATINNRVKLLSKYFTGVKYEKKPKLNISYLGGGVTPKILGVPNSRHALRTTTTGPLINLTSR